MKSVNTVLYVITVIDYTVGEMNGVNTIIHTDWETAKADFCNIVKFYNSYMKRSEWTQGKLSNIKRIPTDNGGRTFSSGKVVNGDESIEVVLKWHKVADVAAKQISELSLIYV